MQKNRIKKICLCAIMSALYVGLDYLAVSVSAPFGGTLKLSISGLSVLIISYFLGPFWAAATGFVGAFLGQMISYGFTATTVLWALPAMVRGLSAGFLFILFKKRLKPITLIPQIILSSLLVTAVNTAVMYIDARVYHYSVVLLGVSLVNRISAAILTSILFAVVLPSIIKALQKNLKLL